LSRYANVTSTLALVIALGGTSYAAVTITGRNVRNGSLTGADIRANSLHSAQVSGLRSSDFAKGQGGGARGPRGPAGPPGQTGPAGSAGSALAWASVGSNGVIDTASSSGIALVSHGLGTYCLNRTAGAVANVVVTQRFTIGQAPVGFTATADATTINDAGCPTGTDILVETSGAGTPGADMPFYIAVIA
jgi:hypothetical protein